MGVCEVMTMHAGRRSHLRPGTRILVAVAVAGAALGLGLPVGTTPGDAADRYIAGGPVIERLPLAADRAAAARATARTFGARLGLAEPAAFRVEHVTDRFASTTYDEVTGTDFAGRALHLQRLDDRGRLIGAVVFGWQSSGGRPLADARAAGDRGRRLAAQLGLEAPGAPETRRLPDDDGWTVSWPRVIDGIPVIGDGVRIDLWPDGRVHAVVRTERALAPQPASILDEAAARLQAEAALVDLFASRAGEIGVARLALGWVAPNDAFDPAAPDAPGSTLRLAWVVEARTTGDLAEGLRAVKLFLDAGSGALLGGDVLR
jgi:hypothetical protein